MPTPQLPEPSPNPESGFGHRPDGTVIDDQAEHIRTAYAQILADEHSLRSLVAAWIKDDIRQKNGSHWQKPSLRRLLLNPRLAGRAGFDPIISEDDYRQMREKLNNPARKTNSTQERRYALTGGPGACGLCGHWLQSQPADGVRSCVCRKQPGTDACGRIRIAAAPYEKHAAAKTLAAIAETGILDQLRPDPADVAAARAELELVENVYGLRKRLVRRTPQVGAIDSLLGDAAQQITALRELVAAAELFDQIPNAVDDEILASWWESLTVDTQRAVHLLFWERIPVYEVRINGYRGYDPGRVKFIPRQPYKTPAVLAAARAPKPDPSLC